MSNEEIKACKVSICKNGTCYNNLSQHSMFIAPNMEAINANVLPSNIFYDALSTFWALLSKLISILPPSAIRLAIISVLVKFFPVKNLYMIMFTPHRLDKISA